MRLRLIAAAFSFFCLNSAQSALARGGAMVCHTDAIPLTLTNYNLALSFPLFDPNDAYGDGSNIPSNLAYVSLRLDGEMLGTVSLTNISESPTSVTGTFAPLVVVQRPDLSPLLTVMLNSPIGPVPLNGLASINLGPLVATDAAWATLNSASDLLLFTGQGTLSLPVVGTGSFSATGGGGNVVSNATTSVGASMDVCYHFGHAPEPGSLALLIFGMAAALSRRSRFWTGCC